MLSRPQSAHVLPSPFDLRLAEEAQAAHMPSTFDHRLGDEEIITPVYAPSWNLYDVDEVPRCSGADAASECSSESEDMKGEHDRLSSASTVPGSGWPSMLSDALCDEPVVYNEPEVIACGSPLKFLRHRQRQ